MVSILIMITHAQSCPGSMIELESTIWLELKVKEYLEKRLIAETRSNGEEKPRKIITI